MDETQLSLAGNPAAGLREVSCTRRVRFLRTDSTDRRSDLTPTRYRSDSVLRCHSLPYRSNGSPACQRTAPARPGPQPKHRCSNPQAFPLIDGGGNEQLLDVSRSPLWRLQSCRQPAVDDEVGASDISCPVAG